MAAGDYDIAVTRVSEAAVQALVAQATPLKAFSTIVADGRTSPDNSVDVPFINTITATTLSGNSNSSFHNGGEISKITVTYGADPILAGVEITDIEYLSVPNSHLDQMGYQLGQAVANKICTDIWADITAANWGAAAFTGAASTFDLDDVIDLRNTMKGNNVNPDECVLVLDNAYYSALLKDGTLKPVNSSGNDDALRNGRVGRLFGMDVYEATNIPSNSENLVGFICHRSAYAVALRPVVPSQFAMNDRYIGVTHPELGVELGTRIAYDPGPTKTYMRMVMQLGFEGQNANSQNFLKRLVSA